MTAVATHPPWRKVMKNIMCTSREREEADRESEWTYGEPDSTAKADTFGVNEGSGEEV